MSSPIEPTTPSPQMAESEAAANETASLSETDPKAKRASKSLSPFRLRLRRFKRLRRGYISFLILVGAYLLSFLLPFLMNGEAIAVKYDGQYYFPAFRNYLWNTVGDSLDTPWFRVAQRKAYPAEWFDQTVDSDGNPIQGDADFRFLKETIAENGKGWVLMPPIPYGPNESFLNLPPELTGGKESPPYRPSKRHLLGTDDRGRDLLVRLAYGYRISMTFALVVVVISYAIGIAVGAMLGFFGRWVDIVGQRFVEIWGAIPFLYTVMIVSRIFEPSFMWLALILSAFGWMSISYYIRGEFYREKAKDYVAAAIANGEGSMTIMFRHILPNALTPVITFAPFAIVASITSLVSLDFLGFGLRAPTPSWGELLRQAQANLNEWHLVLSPLVSMFLTLQLIVFIGEAVREAFDPKVFSRLR